MRTKLIVMSIAAVASVALLVGAPPQETRYPDVPYVPSSPQIVEAMLKLGGVGAKDTHYDLGCGDGRIAIMAVQKFNAASAVGVDIDPERIKEANENAKKAGVTGKVKFVQGDLFTVPIKDATVVTLYLLRSVNMKLRPRLLKELRPGTRVVSHTFDMGEWKPDKEIEVNGSRIYLWTIPKTPPHLSDGQ
jgi:SAM-dependent methyltransferase